MKFWRAARLVFDTGILRLAGRATRQFSISVTTRGHRTRHRWEVDRYIDQPGRALAYKSGELVIKDLRRHAEQTLGKRFDVRAFHDALLSQGTLPLDLLDAHMRRWTAEQLKPR